MTAHSTRIANQAHQVRTARRRLLWSCAAAAIAVTAGTTAQEARAQAFAATPTQPNPNIAVDGSATRTITGGTSETITVASPKATINWTPTDNAGAGTIDFLPAGNVATFTNDPNATADFTVLNRIVPADPTRPIAFNGSVISTLQSASGTATGGHVWFYSPGGIIVGASAVFNVGGLLLTTNDPLTFNQTAGGFTGHFVAGANSTASVTIDPKATISAGANNSYVALVAPRVVQGGNVNVNGSAAYVAGEDVTLTMNQGLFDIQVDVGTSDPYNPDGNNGIVHTGTTGGPASTGPGDNQKIYMVAVPKNQALTMLLAGNVGFTPAGAAQVVNGEIVLSAGWNIYDTSGSRSVSSPVFSDASIHIAPGNYSSNVFGIARGDINAIADTGSLSFLGNLNFNTYDAGNTGNITLGAVSGNSLTVAGSVLLNSSNPNNFSEVKVYADSLGVVDISNGLTIAAGAAPGLGGSARISADGGTVLIGGPTTVTVNGQYFSPADAGLEQFAQYAQGGSIYVTAANGGHIHTKAMTLSANGSGQDSIGGDAGAGYGGYINIDAQTGSDIQVAGALFASATGTGGNISNGTFGSGTYAGYGSGGSIYMNVGDGTIGVTGDVNLDSRAFGGSVGDSGSGAAQYGGTGSGGSAFLSSNGPGSITVGGATNLLVQGTGGNGQTGGSGYGGSAGIYAYDGLIDLGPTIGIFATGYGGNASVWFGGTGGFGGGGSAYIEALANTGATPTAGTITADAGGYALIDASGIGGTGGAGNADNAPGAGGDGQGGEQCFGECRNGGAYALARVDGAMLSLGNVDLRSLGFGGTGGSGGPGQAGGTGGIGRGGITQAGLLDDTFSPTGATTGRASFGNLSLDSTGFGGNGGATPLRQGDGGHGFGGDAVFRSFASDATAASATLRAGGEGGNGGGIGGNGTGGTITIATDGGHIDVTNSLMAQTDSNGGSADRAGTGGIGTGGSVDLTVNGGRIAFTGGDVASRGGGGDGYIGGDGHGGTVDISISDLGGTLAMNGNVVVAAFGGGGNGLDVPGGTGGAGGAGYAGAINVSIAPKLVTGGVAAFNFGNLELRSRAGGGDGGMGLNGGAGGNGVGGTLSFLLGSGATMDGTTLTVRATGLGGSGGGGTAGNGDGGDAQGGSSDIVIDGIATLGGSPTDFNGFVATVYAQGGDGDTGGDANGGTSLITVNGTLNVAGQVQATASAGGGNGGRNGGDANGGTASITVFGDLNTGRAFVATNAVGGSGSAVGGNATAGSASFTVDGGSATITDTGEIRAEAMPGANSTGVEGTASGGLVTLAALNGGTITALDLFLSSYGNLTVPTIGGAITVTGKLDLESDSNIVFGDVAAGILEFHADGTITGGNIIAANKVGGEAEGAIVLGNINVTGPEVPGDFSVGIGSATSILVGNVNGFDRVGFATLGSLTTGNITAGSLFLTLASGNVSVGSITTAPTGQVYMADSSMFIAAGGGSDTTDFDVSLVLPLPPVPTAGSITITGPVSTGRFQAAAGVDFDPPSINATQSIEISAGHDIAVGALTAGTFINLAAGHDILTGAIGSGGDVTADAGHNIQTGNITAAGRVKLLADNNIVFANINADSLKFEAGGTVGGGNIVANTRALGDANGAITLGNITVGPGLPPAGDFSVGFSSLSGIAVGTVNAADRVGFATTGNLTTGNITAGSLVLTLVHGNTSVGSITTAPTGRVYMADSSMVATGGGTIGVNTDTGDFNPPLVLALAPVATGGSINITGPVSTGQLQAAAGTDLTTGALGASSSIDVSAGHDITLGAVTSGGPVTATAGHDLHAVNITSLDRVKLDAANNLVFANINADSLRFDAGGTVGGGAIVVNTRMNGQADGAVTLGNITAGPGLPPTTDFSVSVGSLVGITVGNVQAADRVGFVTPGNLTTGNIQAGSLLMTLVHGNVRTGSVTTAANGRVYIADSGMFATGGGILGANTNGNFDPSIVLALAPVATGGSVFLTGPVSTGQFQAAAGTNLGVGTLTAGSSIDASAVHIATGNLTAGTTIGLTAGNDLSTANIGFGQSVTLNAGNNILVGNLTGGHNVTFTAGNNLSVRDVHADGTATFTAVGLASFLGAVGVPTITVTSSDIDVPFGGSLGVHGITNLLTLNAVSSNPIVIGHTGALAAAAAASHYVLDEAGDIKANTVVINAVGANGGPDPDILVHNVEIDGSLASDPAVSHVVVNTDASVLVDGLVLFTGAGDTDSLALNAGHSIQVNTTSGGRIAMTNASEDRPSGVLSLTSDHIWVGSQSLLDQLNANPNFAGRDALVGINPGAEVPEGFLIANGMTLSIANSLFVQNSGVARNYAGITVGSGGLKIVTTGTAPAQVVAYGRKMNPDGSYVMGNQFFKLVDFTKGSSQYTGQSEFNECLINTGCFVAGGSNLGPEAILGPVDLMGNPQETILWAGGEDEGVLGGLDGSSDGSGALDGASSSSDWSSQLFGTAGGLSDDALVDEGVTSGGDENQWDSQLCKPETNGQPCPTPPADKQEQ